MFRFKAGKCSDSEQGVFRFREGGGLGSEQGGIQIHSRGCSDI